ncbi:hypothetical protein PG993_006459 [Apiospora rasikravindrae]|uniref:Uncharacterized protein n=1 Tax=Apiospora rasikravindrae TaxID=990691 RepID=A0ABR1T5R5_9PEZI
MALTPERFEVPVGLSSLIQLRPSRGTSSSSSPAAVPTRLSPEARPEMTRLSRLLELPDTGYGPGGVCVYVF